MFGKVDIACDYRSDGAIVLRSRERLGDYPQALTWYLVKWAEQAPDRLFLAERDEKGVWRQVTYAEALDEVRRLAGALMTLGLSAERPLAILSGNSIAHALLALAAMHVGIPVAPVSLAYSLVSRDFVKLRHVLDLVTPGAIFVDHYAPFAPALAAIGDIGAPIISGDDGGSLSFNGLAAGAGAASAVQAAHDKVQGPTIAKILFTSGSTGLPKGVINTHSMLCSNQQALAQCWPFIEEQPPVLVDWLPWSHTFGANHNFNLILRNGGSLYIDAGKPAPAAIAATVANLMEISPTIYFNVPAGYEALLPHLERDEVLARRFLQRLSVIFYAAAALPQITWDRLQALSLKVAGRDIPLVSAWGATETAPLATSTYFKVQQSGNIGVPVPGTEIKLAPVEDRLEIRVRGPNVAPGYFRNPAASAEAFDDEGFYRSGDAVSFDPDRPGGGLTFNGRLAENFKLMSGTWVNVGMVRTAFIEALSPLIQDVVLVGEGLDRVAALAFPNVTACREVATDRQPEAAVADLLTSMTLRNAIEARALRYNEQYPASSTRITRLLLLDTAPDIDAGEITDKGYINQKAVLKRRADDVRRLIAADACTIALK